MKFEDLTIPEEVLKGIRAAGFSACTPVQEMTLPEGLRGKDIAAQAQTGTGKTAAFLITVFSRMLTTAPPKPGSSPRALIVAPTRELVVQIEAEAKVLGAFTGARIMSVYGGIDYEKQRSQLAQGTDVLIGTPGRLIDYLKQKVYSLRRIQFFVIDEADRMFDMGFISDLRFLLRRMSPYDQRQSFLFSATLTYRVLELCYEHMNNPEMFKVTPEQVTVEQIEQEIYHVSKSEKAGLLLGILRREGAGHYLIFTNMKSTAEKVGNLLNANGYPAEALTGDLPQAKRLKVLDRFKDGQLPILVATDVASRGLHIKGVTHVINYDLPQDAEDYVHRIGRTARSGASGRAISLACEDYVLALPGIEKCIKGKIEVMPLTDELIMTGYNHPPRRKKVGPPQRGADQRKKTAPSVGKRKERPRRSGSGRKPGG
ncbi:MAG: DEAD/DEAH box helicase [Thermodesulfovibrionales bacterium]